MAPRQDLNGPSPSAVRGSPRVIFQTTDSPQVFLLDHDANGEQIKRWITTAEAMDRFQFDWAKIKRWNVPLASLGLPDGPDISWP